jgi:hypothetical protein
MESGYDDQFGVGPQDILGQSGKEGYYYPERAMAAKQAGYNPLMEAAPLFASKKRAGGQAMGGGGGSQKAPEEPSVFARDAEFYANAVDDVGAAAALTGSKTGRNVFQMYESFDFTDGVDEKNPDKVKRTTFKIIPKGSRQVSTPQGVRELPVHAYAARYGVTNVPFKGGDEAADAFRGLMSDSQTLFGNLTKLEQIYKKNALLTGFGYSEASSEARALEASIAMNFMKVMSGTRGIGGNTSDRDLAMALSMTPQRASSWFTRFKGNETALIKQVRTMAKDKLRSAANANGVDFLMEDEEGGDSPQQQVWENNSTTLE